MNNVDSHVCKVSRYCNNLIYKPVICPEMWMTFCNSVVLQNWVKKINFWVQKMMNCEWNLQLNSSRGTPITCQKLNGIPAKSFVGEFYKSVSIIHEICLCCGKSTVFEWRRLAPRILFHRIHQRLMTAFVATAEERQKNGGSWSPIGASSARLSGANLTARALLIIARHYFAHP